MKRIISRENVKKGQIKHMNVEKLRTFMGWFFQKIKNIEALKICMFFLKNPDCSIFSWWRLSSLVPRTYHYHCSNLSCGSRGGFHRDSNIVDPKRQEDFTTSSSTHMWEHEIWGSWSCNEIPWGGGEGDCSGDATVSETRQKCQNDTTHHVDPYHVGKATIESAWGLRTGFSLGNRTNFVKWWAIKIRDFSPWLLSPL